MVRRRLFQPIKLRLVSFCLTPVLHHGGSFQFHVTQCIHFQIDVVFPVMLFDLVASANVHPPHTFAET